MRTTYALVSVPLVLASLAAPNRAQQDAERARTLFVANCATCHGETGDGKGTTQLDRPARSFMDGGFSFGNTPEALFRTISVGIPGTPMPGFDSSLSEKDRKIVADYVVTLGPPIEHVDEEDTILAVHEKPLVVRGLLPPIAEGAPPQPRGLLIGDPSGITFEYRVDDVRLLGLRQGGFVKRTDWSGRGGTPLEPLGKVVHLVEGGKPESSFFADGSPLTARMSGTRQMPEGSKVPAMGDVQGTFEAAVAMAALDYHVLRDGRELAHVTEIPHVAVSDVGTGYWRDFWLESAAPVSLAFRTPFLGAAEVLARGEEDGERWVVARAPGSAPIFVALDSETGPVREASPGRLEATLEVKPGSKSAGLQIFVLVLVDWNEDVRARLARWWEDR